MSWEISSLVQADCHLWEPHLWKQRVSRFHTSISLHASRDRCDCPPDFCATGISDRALSGVAPRTPVGYLLVRLLTRVGASELVAPPQRGRQTGSMTEPALFRCLSNSSFTASFFRPAKQTLSYLFSYR